MASVDHCTFMVLFVFCFFPTDFVVVYGISQYNKHLFTHNFPYTSYHILISLLSLFTLCFNAPLGEMDIILVCLLWLLKYCNLFFLLTFTKCPWRFEVHAPSTWLYFCLLLSLQHNFRSP